MRWQSSRYATEEFRIEIEGILSEIPSSDSFEPENGIDQLFFLSLMVQFKRNCLPEFTFDWHSNIFSNSYTFNEVNHFQN